MPSVRPTSLSERFGVARPELDRKKILTSWATRPDPVVWPLPSLSKARGINRYEAKTWSQNGEDGILRRLLLTIPGLQGGSFCEIGFHSTEANCIRLALRHGFHGVFFDADKQKCSVFNEAAQHHGIDAKAVPLWVTRSNIVPAMKNTGWLDEQITVLSIDVDGNDLWLMEEILKTFRPS